MLSYWESNTYFKDIDVVIIGSGIIGLNAALNLKLKQPNLKVVVLERGFLPTGASTKNAGFTCFGSPSELLDDLQHLSEDKVFGLVAKRWQGLLKLRKNLGDNNIDFNQWGGYEIFDDRKAYNICSDRLDYLNQQLQPITGLKETYIRKHEDIKRFGFQNIKHLILNVAEGQIDTGKMMLVLTQRVQQLGIIILNAITVTHFENVNNRVQIETSQNFTISANKLLIAVNGFARDLLPDYPVYPARNQVIVTSPIENLKLKGTFHFEEGYYYFRNIGNRVLLGGGRNLDFDGEATSEFGLTQPIQQRLEYLLQSMILPDHSYTIEHRWSGILGLGKNDKTFIVKKVRENIFCSVRMGGMGVAVGSLVGEEAADLVMADY